jgi:thiol:disulfide interchange protein DsbD
MLFYSTTVFAEALTADEAFKTSVSVKDGTISTKIDLSDKIYIYDDKLKYELIEPKKMDLTPYLKLPKPVPYHEFIVFDKDIVVEIPLKAIREGIGEKPFKLKISFQGCSTDGLCYPPIEKIFAFDKNGKPIKTQDKEKKKTSSVWGGGGGFKASNSLSKLKTELEKKSDLLETKQKQNHSYTDVTNLEDKKSPNITSDSDEGAILDMLKNSSFFTVLFTFFILGLGLAFTPCIFPMIPILSSIITLESKQSGKMSAKRGVFLSFVYIVSSALIYAVAGVASAMFGSNILSAMQNPWVIVAFAAIFVALAFSMFGFYEIQLPKSLQNFANRKSDESKGTGIVGVAIMGALSALIVGPCVAPPLAAALIFIGQTGDIVLGGLSLFLLGLGMGAPLLLIGAGGGKFMPKPGGWMTKVSYVFGVVMLGIAIMFLSRIIPDIATMLLWAALFIGSAVFMGVFTRLSSDASSISKLIKTVAFFFLIYGVVLLVGAFSGGSSPLNPLKNFTLSKTKNQTQIPTFITVSDSNDLDTKIKNSEKPTLIDFSAEWCTACKELEEETFPDADVAKLMQNFTLLRVDVTKNSREDKAIQKRFEIVGPPAIIFFRDGVELKNHKIIGFKPPKEFANRLKKVLGE